MFEKVLLKNAEKPDAHGIEAYEAAGGYQALAKVLREFSPDGLIQLVKDSNLKGRGGAGFPTGLKWGFVPKDSDKPKYLCCNADESEPGTFKDRVIMEGDPHMMLEGMALASYAIGAEVAYLYIRGEFVLCIERLETALDEAYRKGYLGRDILGSGFNLDIHMHLGAGAYICGEETAMLESIEGRRGEPKLKPPFPAVAGLYECPTVINNVETLCAIPHIVKNGGEWYRQWGTEKSPGTKLFCVSGHVIKPGNYELPLGFPLIELIEDVCGGMKDGNALKAVIPGGSSVPLINAEEARACKLDYEGCVDVGTMLGCASVIVMDEATDIVKQVRRMVDFYAHESCGQCTPCREGTTWTAQILRRIENGKGTEDDLDTLMEMTQNMVGTTICVLSDSVAAPVQSSIEKFRDEYLALIRRGERMGAV